MKRLLLVAMTVLASSSSVYADQCFAVNPDVADWAAKALKGATIVTKCEPCGDKRPSPPSVVKKVESAPFNGNQRTLIVNGSKTDVAYVYVQTGPATWTNVGLLAGCPAQRVASFLTLAVKHSADGAVCDEVSCVLGNYKGACCAEWKKK